MNRFVKITLFLIVFVSLILALPGPVYAQSPSGGDSPVIFGSDYTLASGQNIKDLVVFGGNANLEKGSTVRGDVVIFGGNIVIDGEVRGDVTTFGGNAQVRQGAVVGGDLNSLGGSTQVSPEATVKGKRVTGIGGLPMGIPNKVYTPSFWVDFGTGAGVLSSIFSSLMLALLAVLITLFLPKPTERVAMTIDTQPIISGAVGLLTLVVTPALFVTLAITVILIPLGLIGLMIFMIALLFGWAALGLEIGKRIAELFHGAWATPVSAGVGTLILSLITSLGLLLTGESFWTLCCVGIPLLFLVMIVGLGGVVASKFGAAVYNPNPTRPVPPAYPPMPQPFTQPTPPPAPPAGQPPAEPGVPPAQPAAPLEPGVPPAPPLPAPDQPSSPLPPPTHPENPAG